METNACEVSIFAFVYTKSSISFDAVFDIIGLPQSLHLMLSAVSLFCAMLDLVCFIKGDFLQLGPNIQCQSQGIKVSH